MNYIEDFKEIGWDEVNPGDMVYIAGNLVDGIPTRVYGPHMVVNPKTQCLKNFVISREFFERWRCLYVKK